MQEGGEGRVSVPRLWSNILTNLDKDSIACIQLSSMRISEQPRPSAAPHTHSEIVMRGERLVVLERQKQEQLLLATAVGESQQ